jgi:hypothetical protein
MAVHQRAGKQTSSLPTHPRTSARRSRTTDSRAWIEELEAARRCCCWDMNAAISHAGLPTLTLRRTLAPRFVSVPRPPLLPSVSPLPFDPFSPSHRPPSRSPSFYLNSFRRVILRAAPAYVRSGGHVLLQWLSYYGVQRARDVCEELAGRVTYVGEVHSSGWVPLWPTTTAAIKTAPHHHTTGPPGSSGLHASAAPPPPTTAAATALLSPPLAPEPRSLVPHLLVRQLDQYAAAERRPKARPYECHPVVVNGELKLLTAAQTAGLARGWAKAGVDRAPLCRWTAHLFRVA